jgi:hypothetical protein
VFLKPGVLPGYGFYSVDFAYYFGDKIAGSNMNTTAKHISSVDYTKKLNTNKKKINTLN